MAAMLITVSTSVNKEMWVKLSCRVGSAVPSSARGIDSGPRRFTGEMGRPCFPGTKKWVAFSGLLLGGKAAGEPAHWHWITGGSAGAAPWRET